LKWNSVPVRKNSPGCWLPEDEVVRRLGVPKGKLKAWRKNWSGTTLGLVAKLDHHQPLFYDEAAMTEIECYIHVLGKFNRHLHGMLPVRHKDAEVVTGEATGPLISPYKAANLLGVTEATMERWRTPDHYGGPRYTVTGDGICYQENDVMEFREALIGLGKYKIGLLSISKPLSARAAYH
jgi:hypothetical protein